VSQYPIPAFARRDCGKPRKFRARIDGKSCFVQLLLASSCRLKHLEENSRLKFFPQSLELFLGKVVEMISELSCIADAICRLLSKERRLLNTVLVFVFLYGSPSHGILRTQDKFGKQLLSA
jgi:hypothetical protein